MGRNFFTGGIMPSHNLLLNFQDNFSIKRHWGVSGKDYARLLIYIILLSITVLPMVIGLPKIVQIRPGTVNFDQDSG